MKCFAYIYWSLINFELKISINLARTVNDTLPLKLAVSSKPDLLPWKRYRLSFATESRLLKETKLAPAWKGFSKEIYHKFVPAVQGV